MVTTVLAFQAFLTFVFLYALIFIVERKRRDIDAFLVAVAVVAPVIAAFLVTIAAGFFGYRALAAWLWMLTLLGVTFVVLRRTLEMPAGRALSYTGAVLVFSLTAQSIMFFLYR